MRDFGDSRKLRWNPTLQKPADRETDSRRFNLRSFFQGPIFRFSDADGRNLPQRRQAFAIKSRD
jgi:hypothetical protein